MAKQPKRKKCTWGCGLVAVEDFADHMRLHEDQTELVLLEQYTVPKEPKRRQRKNNDGGLA